MLHATMSPKAHSADFGTNYLIHGRCRCFVCQQRIADATSEAVEKDAIILAMQRCERKITRLQQRISPVGSNTATA
jgi:hypothetical protein